MKHLVLIGLVLVFSGCKQVTVRDAGVYSEGLNFIDAASVEIVERGKALIERECECSDKIVGVNGFTSSACHRFAETVLVIEARMKYHLEMMEYLGGLSGECPPRNPPDIPDVNTLCKE